MPRVAMPSFPLSARQRRVLAVGVLVVVVLVVAVRHGGSHGAAGGAAATTAPAAATTAAADLASLPAAATASAPSRLVVVDVAGAVRRPGLYRLPQGARVADAVARAGGLTHHADSTLINLAAPLADGEQVLVSAQGGGAVGVAGAGASPSAPVHLNTASVEELDGLPGVGPVTAQKIAAYRDQHGPFSSLDGLDAIPGIGPARIASLKGLAVP
jgi:competence protein ComEA